MNVKRIFAIMLVLCMVFGLCACGNAEDSAANDATEPEVTDAAVNNDEQTDPPAQETQPSGIVYTVKVQDEGGNPIAGAMVQMCEGTNCVPAKSDDAGVATFNVQVEADYEVKFMMLPDGYEYTTEEQVFHFDAGSYEMTITLKAVA